MGKAETNESRSRVVFWSSAEYTFFMKGLLRELRSRGFDAEHRFNLSNHSYRRSKSLPSRCLLRLRMYLVYPLQLCFGILLAPKNTLTVICTNTFFAPLLGTLLAPWKRQAIIHLVYDLFPDALEYAGVLKPTSCAAGFLERITRMTMRRAAANVFLGKRICRHACRRYDPVNRPAIIPVGADAKPFDTEPQASNRNSVCFLYCGNMGRMHDRQTLIDFLRTPPDPRSKWVFHAGGPAYPKFCRALARACDVNPNLHLNPPLDDGAWITAMQQADIALVTMAPGAEQVVMPSKAYSALMAGQALLAICPEESDLADLIYEYDCGWIVPPGKVEALRRTVERILTRKTERQQKQANARTAGHTQFSSAVIAKQWVKLFSQLQKNS